MASVSAARSIAWRNGRRLATSRQKAVAIDDRQPEQPGGRIDADVRRGDRATATSGQSAKVPPVTRSESRCGEARDGAAGALADQADILLRARLGGLVRDRDRGRPRGGGAALVHR